MAVWAWVVDLLSETPRFRHPQGEWLWPQSDRRVGKSLSRIGGDGRYELLGLIREGGQALLWAARDRQTGDALVVVKTVNPRTADGSTGARLSREARLLQLLDGERTVMPVLDWGPGQLRDADHGEFETAQPWLVLPLVEHVLLSDAISARPPGDRSLGADAAWDVGSDLARALRHLHARGVVHRDLSPGNVLLTPRGAVLSDLGMAWAAAMPDVAVEERFTTGLSSAGRGVTWGWLAPEAGRRPEAGQRPDRDPAADVFCWGLHVFAALTGRHPWKHSGLTIDDHEYRQMYEWGAPPDLTGLDGELVPGPLRATVTAALDGDPANRPTAADLVAALGQERPSQVTARAASEESSRAAAELAGDLERARSDIAVLQRRQRRSDLTSSVGAASTAWMSARVLATVAVPILVLLGGGVAWASEARGNADAAERTAVVASATLAASRALSAVNEELASSEAVVSSPTGLNRQALTRDRRTADTDLAAMTSTLAAPPAGGWSTEVDSVTPLLLETTSALTDAREGTDFGKVDLGDVVAEYSVVTTELDDLWVKLAAGLPGVASPQAMDEADFVAAVTTALKAAVDERAEVSAALASEALSEPRYLDLIRLRAVQVDQVALASAHATVDQQRLLAQTNAQDAEVATLRSRALAAFTAPSKDQTATSAAVTVFISHADLRVASMEAMADDGAKSLMSRERGIAASERSAATLRLAVPGGLAAVALLWWLLPPVIRRGRGSRGASPVVKQSAGPGAGDLLGRDAFTAGDDRLAVARRNGSEGRG